MPFEELIAETEECNDFRKLSNGQWMAYSTVADEQDIAIRAVGPTIKDALINLRRKLRYHKENKPA